MNVNYIAQPDEQLGRVLTELLDSNPSASRVIFVSAFVSFQTIMRVKQRLLDLKQAGAEIRFVVGIDLGGTSQEVLKELLEWGADVRIVKHRIPGHTFHPKLYLLQWTDRATLIIGSNNLTEGGFFGNYEGAVLVTYQLPQDAEAYSKAQETLSRFLEPGGTTTYPLTPEFLTRLIAGGDAPTEAEARNRRNESMQKLGKKRKKGDSIYGTEDVLPPPPLPADLLVRLVKGVQARRRASKAAAKKRKRRKTTPVLPVETHVSDPLLPAAFYMTLPKLQGRNIPGEARIPLEAIELAKEFWGWPEEYSKETGPRSGRERVYWNWRPEWKVWSVESPADVTIQKVRMYMYQNSSDFRFYARPLVNAGGNVGDVVRLRRIAEPEAEFECVLARQGSPEYTEWIKYCTQPVRNSTRSFGYA